MIAPITFPSALYFWKHYDNLMELHESSHLVTEQAFDSYMKRSLLSFAAMQGMEIPLHIMVSNKGQRKKGEFISHVIPKGLPEGSFVQLSEAVHIASPELTFLLAAKTMSIAELAVLACDLSGIYYLAESAEYGQKQRTPITSVEKIAGYLQNVQQVEGLKKARVAIQYAMNRSNSPMESKLAVAGSLRYHYGGYSISKPELNYEVELSETGKTFLKRNSCCCDMVWPDLKVVVEYDSDLAHLLPGRVRYDKRRTTALQLSGYTVITITRDHFSNENTIEELFLLITKTVEGSINKRALLNSHAARMEVIKKLFLIDIRYYANVMSTVFDSTG